MLWYKIQAGGRDITSLKREAGVLSGRCKERCCMEEDYENENFY